MQQNKNVKIKRKIKMQFIVEQSIFNNDKSMQKSKVKRRSKK